MRKRVFIIGFIAGIVLFRVYQYRKNIRKEKPKERAYTELSSGTSETLRASILPN